MSVVMNARVEDFSIKVEHDRELLNYASLGKNSNKFYLAVLEEGSGVYGDYRGRNR